MVKTIKQGVFYTLLKNGNKSFYIKYSLSNKQYKIKLGLDTDGWTAHKAFKEREKRLSNSIKTVSNATSITLDVAFDKYIESIAQKTDCYNTKSRYKTHIKNVHK